MGQGNEIFIENVHTEQVIIMKSLKDLALTVSKKRQL